MATSESRRNRWVSEGGSGGRNKSVRALASLFVALFALGAARGVYEGIKWTVDAFSQTGRAQWTDLLEANYWLSGFSLLALGCIEILFPGSRTPQIGWTSGGEGSPPSKPGFAIPRSTSKRRAFLALAGVQVIAGSVYWATDDYLHHGLQLTLVWGAMCLLTVIDEIHPLVQIGLYSWGVSCSVLGRQRGIGWDDVKLDPGGRLGACPVIWGDPQKRLGGSDSERSARDSTSWVVPMPSPLFRGHPEGIRRVISFYQLNASSRSEIGSPDALKRWTSPGPPRVS